jgi:hypothetical protein
MVAAIKAGAAYFAVVFVVGFILGTIRALLVVPNLGPTIAVLIEIPIMLAISWIACRRCTTFFLLPHRPQARLLMGVVALTLLMVAEALLAIAAFGQSLGAYVTFFGTAPGAIGLAAQIAFGLIPLVQCDERSSRSRSSLTLS